jgi:hypothetical protein
MARLERFVPRSFGRVGRPLACRVSLARAFVAKVVFEIATTTLLVERLRIDRRLRRLCGWERVGELPSEATFSRAFAAFAASTLPERAHAAVIEASQAARLMGHIARDSSAIPARERPPRLVRQAKPAKRQKRGRPRKSEGLAGGNQAAPPLGTTADDVARSDARRSAAGLQHRHQAVRP